MLCYWPDTSLPNKNDWQTAQAGKANPVNQQDWVSGTNTSGFPDWIASRLSTKGFITCDGSEECCFRGMGLHTGAFGEILPAAW